jgi:hypothetical protein
MMMSFADDHGMRSIAESMLEERRAEAARDQLAQQLPTSTAGDRLRIALAAGLRVAARALDDQPLDFAPSRS